ncbi:MAG: phospho-N-acetylmuramoyl-pentapeptide-transferase [Bacteroidota bacterium]
MLYYLFRYIHEALNWPGTGVFKYISFRAAAAAILSVLITIVLGRKLIRLFQAQQIKDGVRALGLEGQDAKGRTPTMGGISIIAAIIIPTLLFAKLDNTYVILLLTATLWMGTIGFIDDYIKVFKKGREGLAGRFKLFGQVGLGLIVGLTLYFHQDVVVRELETPVAVIEQGEATPVTFKDVKSTKTTVPFFKNNELDYSKLIPGLDKRYTWLVYVFMAVFIVAAVSNAANLTDGLDGLAAGTSAIIGITLGILAYLSGNVIFSQYLNIMYIPNLGELVIFCTAFVGACGGFLWYNAYPAQIFMGDTGSLTIGGIIAVLAIMIRKELLIPLLCGIFVIENLSVIIQVAYFKYTKRRYGVGQRIFKMAPIHHHYQKLGLHEAKIVARFWIVGVLLAILTLVTLKLR